MSVSKQPVDPAFVPAGEAVGRVEPSGADSAFVFYELKKRDQSIVAEILCRKCYDERPEAAHPLTEREIAAGYRYSVRPYSGDHECMQCEKKPEQPKAEGYDDTMRKVG